MANLCAQCSTPFDGTDGTCFACWWTGATDEPVPMGEPLPPVGETMACADLDDLEAWEAIGC